MKYVDRDVFNQYVQAAADAWHDNPKQQVMDMITKENGWLGYWQWWIFADERPDNTSTSTTNTSNTSNTSNTTDTTSTSTTNNSSIVDNTKTDSTNTINWTTTEEQAPTTTTSKEWSTINLPDKEEAKTETQSPSESVSDSNVATDTKTQRNKANAYNTFKEVLSRTIWDDKFGELEKWNYSDESSSEWISTWIEDVLKEYWYSDIETAMWDINALYKLYEENPDAWKKDISTLLSENPSLARAAWVLFAFNKWWFLSKLGKIITAPITRPIKKLASSKLVAALAKKWPVYAVSSAIWLASDVIPDTIDRTKWYVWQSRTLDREWNSLPYWKQFLWWVLNNTEKTFWLWIPSLLIELGKDNLPDTKIWDYFYNNFWIDLWKMEVPRENTQEQQKQGKIDKKVLETFKNSQSYQWWQNLSKVAKKYWDDEADLASRIMTSGIATFNLYDLWDTWENMTPEARFKNFEYDPQKHNWYWKNNNDISVFDIINGLSIKWDDNE